mgnify:CR=1 FL=1
MDASEHDHRDCRRVLDQHADTLTPDDRRILNAVIASYEAKRSISWAELRMARVIVEEHPPAANDP